MIVELELKNDFSSLEEKANNIGLINQIKLAIKQIQICEKWGIYPSSIIKQLPPTEVTEYRIMDDGESNDRKYWKEVSFENAPNFYLSGGDLVIQK